MCVILVNLHFSGAWVYIQGCYDVIQKSCDMEWCVWVAVFNTWVKAKIDQSLSQKVSEPPLSYLLKAMGRCCTVVRIIRTKLASFIPLFVVSPTKMKNKWFQPKVSGIMMAFSQSSGFFKSQSHTDFKSW